MSARRLSPYDIYNLHAAWFHPHTITKNDLIATIAKLQHRRPRKKPKKTKQ